MKIQNNKRPIGIFDSGIGGLTVVKEIIKALPDEDIVYFGDTARVPYGNKSAQTVIKFSLENVRFLLKFGVKLIIVACNTSSSLALPILKNSVKIPLLGVIKPAVKKAVQISSTGRIGIIGTRATIASSCYQREIKKVKPGCKSFTAACPLFVPLAEEGWLTDKITAEIAQRYLQPLLKKNIDTLILGCTHYPLLKNTISRVTGRGIKFVDSAQALAVQAKELLIEKALCAGAPGKNFLFFVSDEPERFRKVGKAFLGKEITLANIKCTA